MADVIEFLKSIVEFIETAFTALIQMIESMFVAIGYIASSVPTQLGLVGFYPTIIGASASFVIAVGVAKLVVGWGNK